MQDDWIVIPRLRLQHALHEQPETRDRRTEGTKAGGVTVLPLLAVVSAAALRSAWSLSSLLTGYAMAGGSEAVQATESCGDPARVNQWVRASRSA